MQQTAKLQELTQNRLSTGLRVNSAIDNPSSYYTAAALNNRASDLSALLDAMSQGIQTLKTAQQGLQTASTFLEQATSIANQALETEPVPAKEWFEQQVGENGAVVSTAQELRNAVAADKETIVVYGKIDLGDISATDGISLKANQKLVGVGYYGNFDTNTNKFSSITATSSVADKNLINASKGGNEISNLSLSIGNTISSSRNRTISLNGAGVSNQNTYNLSNLDITCAANGYTNFGISADNYAIVNIQRNVNILTGGLEGHGIIANYSSKVTIDSGANIDIQTNTPGGSGIYTANSSAMHINFGAIVILQSNATEGSWNGIYTKTSSTTNINSGAIVNIKTNGNYGYGIASFDSSQTNIAGNATVNIKTEHTYGIVSYNLSAINIKTNANVNIQTDGGFGIYSYRSSAANIFGNISIKNNNSRGIVNSSDSNNTTTIGSSAQIYLATGSEISLLNDRNYAGNGPNLLSIAAGAKIAIEKDGNAKWYQMQSDYEDRNTSTSTANAITADNIETVLNVAVTSPWQLPEIITAVADEKIDKDVAQSYQNILTQFDALIKDSSYQGINLLQNNSLSINFNEDRSSKLEIKGIDASADKLGLKTKEWENKGDIAQSLSEIASALKQIRSHTQELGNYYSIVTTREDFTEKLINVLTEGADKLTLADMNEESANSLMLETRQNLAINALSLASQAGRSILKLF